MVKMCAVAVAPPEPPAVGNDGDGDGDDCAILTTEVRGTIVTLILPLVLPSDRMRRTKWVEGDVSGDPFTLTPLIVAVWLC